MPTFKVGDRVRVKDCGYPHSGAYGHIEGLDYSSIEVKFVTDVGIEFVLYTRRELELLPAAPKEKKLHEPH